MSRHRFRSCSLVVMLVLSVMIPSMGMADEADDRSNEKAMAVYADAANFQNGGAIPLAIEGWNAFLKDYPDHPMASQASHYLGVCYMQQAKPDYSAATQAFRRALRDKKYDRREESLANCGWCLYTDAGQAPNQDQAKLRAAIQIFEQLQKESPESEFMDRAWFYRAEAHYGLGETERAIQFYNRLLSSPKSSQSVLRCDALYARGVAYEELKQFAKANASFEQLLSGCADSELVTDVHLRVGDLAILREQFDAAVESFQSAFDSTREPEDQAYAIYRQAFAHAKANRPEQASGLYERLLSQFPDSAFTSAATLASAQSAYRSGNNELASKRFAKVMEQSDRTAATEAAHWLARIRFNEQNPEAALEIAQKQIRRGVEGEFVTALKLDVAEAYSRRPQTLNQAYQQFKQVYQEHPADALAPRALYNAAFFALQLNQLDEAVRLATEFSKRFPQDTLAADVMSIQAEAELASGNVVAASRRYERLLKDRSVSGNPQRPLWVIRGAATLISSGRTDDAIELLKSERNRLPESAQRAEAELLMGQAYMKAGRPDDAAEAFAASRRTNSDWVRAGEAGLLQGTALLNTGQKAEAEKVWNRLIRSEANNRMADQARFKLGQLAMSGSQYEIAVGHFDQIIESNRDVGLVPYAKFAKTQALVQQEEYADAVATIGPWLAATSEHPLKTEALISMGVAQRELQEIADSRQAFQTALQRSPKGNVLATLLYEAALTDQADERPREAITKLRRIVREVPGYQAMDKVVGELGWALRDDGQEDSAAEEFTTLIREYPESDFVAEAAYFLAQRSYKAEDWDSAVKQYQLAADKAQEDSLSEKALYRLGWAFFKDEKWQQSREAFQLQQKRHAEGRFAMDALMMIGESDFKAKRYEQALDSYSQGRAKIRQANDSSKTLTDAAERQIRELILLHGGQSAAQLDRWQESLEWYNELRERFPSTAYLPQVFYETAFSYQQSGNTKEALRFYGQVAQKYRNEIAARARFMMGEIHFGERRYDEAMTEFQRVMYGFGAAKAAEKIKPWQAKSGYEAGRCSEILIKEARTAEAQAKASQFARRFYDYVLTNHPNSEMAVKAGDRLKAMKP